MNDFIMINEKKPPMENGHRKGVSRNGHANGSLNVEKVNGTNGHGAVEIERPVVNARPIVAVKEQRAQLRGVGVVGLGYWGPNWVRNLYQSQAARRISLAIWIRSADRTSANCTRTSKPPAASKTC